MSIVKKIIAHREAKKEKKALELEFQRRLLALQDNGAADREEFYNQIFDMRIWKIKKDMGLR